MSVTTIWIHFAHISLNLTDALSISRGIWSQDVVGVSHEALLEISGQLKFN